MMATYVPVFMVPHNLGLAKACNRTIWLGDGKKVEVEERDG